LADLFSCGKPSETRNGVLCEGRNGVPSVQIHETSLRVPSFKEGERPTFIAMGDAAVRLDDTLNRLGALDRFCKKTGITREGLLEPEHRDSIYFLLELKVQPVLQRLVLEYAAHLIVDGPGLACPVCGDSLTTDAAAAAIPPPSPTPAHRAAP
jgi:hypothetical protein